MQRLKEYQDTQRQKSLSTLILLYALKPKIQSHIIMNNIANTIYQAIVAHTAWKKRLREIIDTGENVYDINSESCEFSKLLNEHADELGVHDCCPKIVDLHNEFHKEAAKIIQFALNGQQQEANEAIEYGRDFDNISQELVKNLIVWHDDVMQIKDDK